MTSSTAVDAALFSRFVPIGSLKPERQADLARKSTLRRYAAGDHLFRAGDDAQSALYVLSGEVSLEDADGKNLSRVRGGEPEAAHRLAHQSPRTVSARCLSPVVALAVDAGLLDVMLTWDQTGTFEVHELGSGGGGDDWMARLLQMQSFQRLPPANLQAMFMRMQSYGAEAGQVIVKQGDEGDYFYVIVEGRCIVTREPPSGKAVRLAEFEPGAVFGEEALIADAKRNATVTALTPCRLMRLAKSDFLSLLDEPLTRRLELAAARTLVESGRAVWLDVRLPSEFQAGHLPGAVNLPLYMLRPRIASLNPDSHYIAVCDSGRRSSVAAFVLTQKGFEAYVLDGGMSANA